MAHPRHFRISAALLIGFLGGSAGASEWEPMGENDGVRVAMRSVGSSHGIKEIRAEAVMEVNAEAILAVLGDIVRYPEFMPPTEAVQLLRKDADATYYHMVISPPVIHRRDYCTKVEVHRFPDGRLRSSWTEAPQGCPAPARGTLRIEQNHGYWILTPLKEGQATHVVYNGFTDPGGQVPAWMVNLASARSMPKVFRAVRQAAQSPRYARR